MKSARISRFTQQDFVDWLVSSDEDDITAIASIGRQKLVTYTITKPIGVVFDAALDQVAEKDEIWNIRVNRWIKPGPKEDQP